MTTYGLAPLPDEPQRELDARFGEAIRLRGYSLTGDRFEPGDILPITLYWESMVPVSERYKVTVQLLDSGGVLRAQRDAEPGNGLYPTTEWAQSATTIDRLGVGLPPDLATDDYSLIVGMYHISSGERLPVAGRTDHVRLGTVTVR